MMQLPETWASEIPRAVLTGVLAILSWTLHKAAKNLRDQAKSHEATRLKANLSFVWIKRQDPTIQDSYDAAMSTNGNSKASGAAAGGD